MWPFNWFRAPPAPAPAAAVASAPPPVLVSAELLRSLGVTPSLAALWSPTLTVVCAKYSIDTPLRLAAWLANVLHESRRLQNMRESLQYRPHVLLEHWPEQFSAGLANQVGLIKDSLGNTLRPADERAIADIIYQHHPTLGNTLPGDGYLFRGRGPIQITGRHNYTAVARRLNTTAESLVEVMDKPLAQAVLAESSAIWWDNNGCNQIADRGDIKAVRKRVNNKLLGLSEVTMLYEAALRKLTPVAGVQAAKDRPI